METVVKWKSGVANMGGKHDQGHKKGSRACGERIRRQKSGRKCKAAMCSYEQATSLLHYSFTRTQTGRMIKSDSA